LGHVSKHKLTMFIVGKSACTAVFPAARSLLKLRNAVRQRSRTFILGIETSCDDSGAAILSAEGKILGEDVATQTSARYGGVIPSFAMGFHADALPKIVDSVLRQSAAAVTSSLPEEMMTSSDAKLESLRDHGVEMVAVTTRPGMSGSLSTGVNFAKFLCIKNKLPMIPIHHMEAHALTARMTHKIDFPFMVLLVSGGHCLLAMATDVNKYLLLGKCNDNAPGQVFDKVARRLRLHLLRPDLRDVSGGKAIQTLALGGDPTAFPFHIPMKQHRDCKFSLSGLHSHITQSIEEIERENKIHAHDSFIPDLPHFCASVEYSISKHICERVQRGFDYADLKSLWQGGRFAKKDESSSPKTLVVSGGVAANHRLRSSIEKVCQAYEIECVVPAPKYCTDNGVMIAWNGLEKLRAEPQCPIVDPKEIMEVEIKTRSSFGHDISHLVAEENIKCKFVDIL